MAIPTIQNFWHNADRNAGFAKTNRFLVQITVPTAIGGGVERARSLQLQCESAELPGKSLATQDVKVYGPAYKMATHKQYTNEITLTFLCTVEGGERKFFNDWIDYISPDDTNNLRFPDTYYTSITITQYNDLDNGGSVTVRANGTTGDDNLTVINRVILTDVFPIGYAGQPMNWGEDGFQRLAVQFAYNKYTQLR